MRSAPAKRSEALRPSERRRAGVRGALAPRKILERETGIEPATNSLEGCDSTTELLPPSRLACLVRSPLRRASPPSSSTQPSLTATAPCYLETCSPNPAGWPDRARRFLPACPAGLGSSRLAGLPAVARRASAGRRLVARGGFEPPKPLGRQIYSLLRLTASLPRRYRAHTFQPGEACSRADG